MRGFDELWRFSLVMAAIGAIGLQISCAPPTDHDRDGTPSALVEAPASTEGSISKSLAGTQWKLARIQTAGKTPKSLSTEGQGKYQMRLADDGRVEMLLSCAKANGPWAADPVAGEAGSFMMGPLDLDQAKCSDSSLDSQIVQDMNQVTSYLKRDGELDLTLKGDGGTYVWEPDDEQ